MFLFIQQRRGKVTSDNPKNTYSQCWARRWPQESLGGQVGPGERLPSPGHDPGVAGCSPARPPTGSPPLRDSPWGESLSGPSFRVLTNRATPIARAAVQVGEGAARARAPSCHSLQKRGRTAARTAGTPRAREPAPPPTPTPGPAGSRAATSRHRPGEAPVSETSRPDHQDFIYLFI
ncbi:translation initiation factor IF-2-like [Vulpes lagopus]|uniref:translation initiation factor IF-2-like n=1 Tax=Vulpes lagopus TaxID=494514 RepID=UPI001BCA2267|nr:translation initiation factor IF-2-like [Vulpes lagopus]